MRGCLRQPLHPFRYKDLPVSGNPRYGEIFHFLSGKSCTDEIKSLILNHEICKTPNLAAYSLPGAFRMRCICTCQSHWSGQRHIQSLRAARQVWIPMDRHLIRTCLFRRQRQAGQQSAARNTARHIQHARHKHIRIWRRSTARHARPPYEARPNCYVGQPHAGQDRIRG